MKKSEAEPAIRQIMGQWRTEPAQSDKPVQDLEYSDFRRSVDANHHSHYFDFRSTMGPEEDAERWFAQEFRQGWRY